MTTAPVTITGSLTTTIQDDDNFLRCHWKIREGKVQHVVLEGQGAEAQSNLVLEDRIGHSEFSLLLN